MSTTAFTEVVQNPHYNEVEDVTPDQVAKAESQLVIVDVRENDEWSGELGHIKSAKLINLGFIPDKMSEIPRDRTVVLVCRSGGRSARAAAFLKQNGYTTVYNMSGGMMSWNQKGFPISK